MEDSDEKICPNCKREIPTVNFTIHSVHCARNIRVCPVCKEPVPQAELQDHHDKLHKLMPCKECGESVCGTDLEDHIRDSCAHTIKSCRFCELELPRRDLPAHEGYCGVRTEQCPDCREWVMIKYRQLHLDSNHGFIRLDDDPAPLPKKEIPKNTNLHKLTFQPAKVTNLPSTSNGLPRLGGHNIHDSFHLRPRTMIRSFNGPSNAGSSGTAANGSTASGNGEGGVFYAWQTQAAPPSNGFKAPFKRTNDQPQINTNVAATNKVEKNLSIARGAVKKRPAPKPPSQADPRRDQPYFSALQRQQREEQQRQQQTAANLAAGLPPVLSASAKLDKLRKMDALQNPDTTVDYKDRLQGRVWKSPEQNHAGHVLGTLDNEDNARRREEFKNLTPMTPQEFTERFKKLQMRRDDEEITRTGDRFNEIKSSLRELRRGLNEVTAPYNMNSNAVPTSSNRERARPSSPRVSPRASPVPTDAVRLPCEFCGALVPADDLVQHQTGCRPDLAQFRAAGAASRAQRAQRALSDEPVIPCEFCTESLPVYLISEHQERCGRDSNLLYAD